MSFTISITPYWLEFWLHFISLSFCIIGGVVLNTNEDSSHPVGAFFIVVAIGLTVWGSHL